MIDDDGNETLDFAAFERLVTKEVTKSKMSYVRKYFQMYDKNKDGVITVEEVSQSLQAQGYSEEHIKNAIEELMGDADFNKDQEVSYEGRTALQESYTKLIEQQVSSTTKIPSGMELPCMEAGSKISMAHLHLVYHIFVLISA